MYYFEPRKPTTGSEVFRTYDEKWNLSKANPKIPATGRPPQSSRRLTTPSTPSVNRNGDDFSHVTHASAPDNTVTNMLLGAVVYDAISSDHSSHHSSYDSSSSSYDSGSSSSDCGSSSSDGGGSCGGCD